MTTYYKIDGAPAGTLLSYKTLFKGRIRLTVYAADGDEVCHDSGDDKHDFLNVWEELRKRPELIRCYGANVTIGDRLTPGEQQRQELDELLRQMARGRISPQRTAELVHLLFKNGVYS